MLKSKIQKIITKAVPEMADCNLEIPENKNFGHFSTNCALKLAKVLSGVEGKKPPMTIAGEFAKRISDSAPKNVFEKVEAVAPGFINFTLTNDFIQKEFVEIYKTISKQKGNPSSFLPSRGEDGRKSLRVQIIGPPLPFIGGGRKIASRSE